MKLLLDEMYAPAIAEQPRGRGHDVASEHDPSYRTLEGEPDAEVWAAAVADDRALVSENVQDLRRLEADALARAQPRAPLILRPIASSPEAHRRPSVVSSLPSTRCSPQNRISPPRCSSSLPEGRLSCGTGSGRATPTLPRLPTRGQMGTPA